MRSTNRVAFIALLFVSILPSCVHCRSSLSHFLKALLPESLKTVIGKGTDVCPSLETFLDNSTYDALKSSWPDGFAPEGRKKIWYEVAGYDPTQPSFCKCSVYSYTRGADGDPTHVDSDYSSSCGVPIKLKLVGTLRVDEPGFYSETVGSYPSDGHAYNPMGIYYGFDPENLEVRVMTTAGCRYVNPLYTFKEVQVFASAPNVSDAAVNAALAHIKKVDFETATKVRRVPHDDTCKY